MDKFPFDALIDFLVTFVKKLLDRFNDLSKWANDVLGEEETTNA